MTARFTSIDGAIINDPIIASLKQTSNGGTINMPTVASGQTKTLATTTDTPANMVTTDTTQTITGQKTIVNPIFTDSYQDCTFVLPSDEDFIDNPEQTIVTNDSFATLTNKELICPILRYTSSSPNLMIPNDLPSGSAYDIATTTSPQTLQNKTLKSSDVTTYNSQSYESFLLQRKNSSITSTTYVPISGVNGGGPVYLDSVDSTATLSNKTLTTPVIASLKQTSNGGTINMPTVASGSSVTLATLDDIPSSSSSTSSPTETTRFIKAAMCLMATYPTYPTTFLPLSRKIRFSGWDNETWNETAFTTFLTYLNPHATGTTICTPNGISLTSITAAQINYTLSSITDCSIIFGTTRLSSANTAMQMFYGCTNVTSLDLFQFDTSNVTSMNLMFLNCSSLTKLDVSNFDTSNVTSMTSMFSGCRSLTGLDVSSFNTSNVTSMDSMFLNCSSLTKLDVSNFDTSNVETMTSMFDGCTGLTELDLSNFDTTKLTTTYQMFYGCTALKSLDLSKFITTYVLGEIREMFNGCSALEYIDASHFYTRNVSDFSKIFYNCTSLTYIDMSDWSVNTGLAYSAANMFTGCTALTTLICTKATLNALIDLNCRLTNTNNIGSDISDSSAHTWTISNLAITAVV